jgi:hypothetical protein
VDCKAKITRGRMTRLISLPAVFLLVISCSSTQVAIEDAAKRAALVAARPLLEKIFNAEAPIAPSNRELFPIVQKLPGKPFEARRYFGNRLNFSNGTVELPPGDYVIPVMSYCMKSSGSSPSAHRYLLGKISGRAAGIIGDLNAKALSKFDPKDVQVVSWSIQNGVPFDEMSDESKKIIDAVIPEHRKELEKSFFRVFSEKWDGIADKMGLSRFDEVTDQTLGALGDLGQEIRAIKEFRRTLRESEGNYDSLRALISLPGVSGTPGTESATPWSQLSQNIYARFLTSGHYLDVGELQIRVVVSKRSPQASKNEATKIDISSLIADPGTGGIQPLSFSVLSGILAVEALPASASPALIAAVIAAVLAEKYVDWDAFSKAVEKFGNSVKDLIQKGLRALSKEHDNLEKPIRDTGILDGATLEKGGGRRRIYSKQGGQDALNRDFEKSPGRIIPSDSDVRIKESPNGDRVVARNRSTDGAPTLEVQPKDVGKGNRIRVEVRYR